VYSLIIMVALLQPLSQSTFQLLEIYDNVICAILLVDFGLTLYRSPSRSTYFFKERGWLDLLGSVPSLVVFRLTVLLRLARLSRLARINRILRAQNQRELLQDVLRNRGQYVVFVTLILGMLVLSLSVVIILQFESQSPDANITTGGHALWWAVVTITTVGYGDKYPVTAGGRLVALRIMDRSTSRVLV
jgi:voltage-gated potassium channel